MVTAPKILSIHDSSALGRCSLSVISPVLSVLGNQCCPLTTAVLSSHLGFPHKELQSFVDLTPHMEQSLTHWSALDASFQGIYSGFLGSPLQIKHVHYAIERFKTPDTFLLIDPVMADHGKLYSSYTPEMCQGIVNLASQADLITPNLTEACILLGRPLTDVPSTEAEYDQWLLDLSLSGSRSVVLTGVSDGGGQLGAGIFCRDTQQIFYRFAPQVDAQFSGTGDLFASVLLGYLMSGLSLSESTKKAVHFVSQSVAYTVALGTPILDGVCFEPLLKHLL